jgi:tRNA pseudouridine55 synthase
MDGILSINKPQGMSSTKCKDIVLRKLNIKKVGFLGTLDPNACGVLVLLCGKATKLADSLHTGSKVYRSVFTFGIETTTLDLEGEITHQSDKIPTREEILKVLPSLTGNIEIEVPKFSAVHINGKRAYELARQGVDFTPPKKQVEISRFELLTEPYPTKSEILEEFPHKNKFYFEIECNAGTYIRSLAKLLAEKLETYAIASTIIRVQVGNYSIENAKSIDEVTVGDLDISLLSL